VRVPSPNLLKIDKDNLLEDVRSKLAEKYPDYSAPDDGDATDPAWVILEQAAWLVELLSEQLDQYPYAMIQEFVHLMGGKLAPAVPSLGVMIASPLQAGELTLDAQSTSPWRFFTLQTEELDIIEFASIEPKVHVRPSSILSMTEVKNKELFMVGGPKSSTGIGAQEAWKTYQHRSRIFDEEWVRYDLTTSNAQVLVETIENAVASLEERKIGWLEFRVEQISNIRVSVFARINLPKAFEHFQPSGLSDGDVRGHWGTLDNSTWTPPVRVASLPTLNHTVRGTEPMPGLRRGTILVPNIPDSFETKELLERKSMPLKKDVVDSIWETLTHMDQKLATLNVSIARGVEPSSDEREPSWVSMVLNQDLWAEVIDRTELRLIHIEVAQPEPTGGAFRVSLVLKGVSETNIPPIRIFGIDDNGMERVPLRHNIAWRLRLPDPNAGQRMVLVVALDVQLAETHKEILLVTECDPMAVMCNTLLVGNLPSVQDGRQIEIVRNIPEPVNLLYDDLVNKDVVEHLLRDNIAPDVAALLKKLPLAYFPVQHSSSIVDFEGVWLDPTSTVGEGALMRFNAPDGDGYHLPLRPGRVVQLDWYRRTDGEYGNVGRGAIQIIEQPTSVEPNILEVFNPLDTFYGLGRENEQEAIDRMFNPSGRVAVLPTDWERLLRVNLGMRARGWVVRCWSHPERSLVSHDFWPPPTDETAVVVRSGSQSRVDELYRSGPDTMLVIVGSKERIISDSELDWARGLIEGVVRRQQQRLPLVKKVIVMKFWPLILQTEENNPLPLPCFDIGELRGTLKAVGSDRAEEIPNKRLLLNAAIVDVEVRDV
jgi:hypothetical protein